MDTCIRLREALVVKVGDQSTNCWSANQWLRMPEVDVQTDWLQKSLQFSAPFVDTGMLEAIQDRLQVSEFHKAINFALEDKLIRKLKEYRRCHHQMWYISRRCSVTLAVLYRAQSVECLAGQEYLWIQVQKWYQHQPPPLHGRHQAICQEWAGHRLIDAFYSGV